MSIPGLNRPPRQLISDALLEEEVGVPLLEEEVLRLADRQQRLSGVAK
jgi:hypothetical protein